MTRNHDEPNINILLARNLPFESDVRQWSHPLMIPLHGLWAKSNNTTLGQFECDMTWFCFCFDFVRSFTCTVRLLFHSLFTFSSGAKKKILIAKWVLKMWIIINKRHRHKWWGDLVENLNLCAIDVIVIN